MISQMFSIEAQNEDEAMHIAIEKYENGLNEIKKIDSEIFELKNKICDFVKEINM